MIKIGITGQDGFIGSHLYNTLALTSEIFIRIPFKDDYFNDIKKLQEFVNSCEIIVHLAALNRHSDASTIYQTNIILIKQLIEACEIANAKPHILFSSSTQEILDNPYGKSKKEGSVLFEKWAEKNSARFTSFVIPNVYGPFGNPYYNSFISTFCHQLTHNEKPSIHIDGQVKIIFVSELISEIIEYVKNLNNDKPKGTVLNKIHIEYTYEGKVSEILKLLEQFKKQYFENGIIPNLNNTFCRNLFNTFVCYIDHHSFFPFKLKKNTDNRGSFVETIKLGTGGQISFSTTIPGITRGNHFHTHKAERFAVIRGKALIELRKTGTDKILSFELDGETPSFVDMPIWYTHNITNTGNEDLYTIFWISEIYDEKDPDTFYEEVKTN